MGTRAAARDQHAGPRGYTYPNPVQLAPRATASTCSGAAATSTHVLDVRRRPHWAPAGRSSACPASVPTSRWPPTASRRSTSRSPTGTLARRRLACTTRATPPARGSGRTVAASAARPSPRATGPGLGRRAHRSARLGPRRRLRRGGGPAHRLRGLPLADRPPLPPRAVDGPAWQHRQVTQAGGTFPEDGREREYSGGIVFDHADPAVLYLSRQVRGQWEIERWRTPDGGTTWTHQALTAGSPEKNVRPVVARGGGRCGCVARTSITGATARLSSPTDPRRPPHPRRHRPLLRQTDWSLPPDAVQASDHATCNRDRARHPRRALTM